MLKDEFYIVMEYCDNRDALSYLKKIRREESTQVWLRAVLHLCVGVCDAMRFLHNRGFTHRDITACNILVQGDRAMLADLGLARRDTDVIDVDTDYMPQNHSLYAPPEVIQNPLAYTKGSDVFCFGIALWEMLMLRRWSIDNVRDRPEALSMLDQYPLFFKNIVDQCWHEEDLFRPTFEELLREFVYQSQQEWSAYREVLREHSLEGSDAPVSLNCTSSSDLRSFRVQSFSAADIVENSLYLRPESRPTPSPEHSLHYY